MVSSENWEEGKQFPKYEAIRERVKGGVGKISLLLSRVGKNS